MSTWTPATSRGSVTRVPYEAFTLEATVGGGSTLSEAVARGRFYGKPFGADGRYQFTVLQTFDYLVNRAYAFGGQGFEAEVALSDRWASHTKVRLSASGGVSALAAVDSLIPPPPEAGDPEEAFTDPDSRRYDYGPGFRIAGNATLTLDRTLAGTLSYSLYHVAVVDGFRSNHVLQRAYPGRALAAAPTHRGRHGGRILPAQGLLLGRERAHRSVSAIPRLSHVGDLMRINRFVHLVLTLSLAGAGIAQAQTEPTPPSDPDAGLGLWIVAGGGGVLARGHCSTCSREGVFFYSPGLLVDAGIQINRRVDAGIEVSLVSSRIEDLEPIRTTFVLGVGQFRPWADYGLSLRAGMGIGFVGNGIYNFAQRNLEPPVHDQRDGRSPGNRLGVPAARLVHVPDPRHTPRRGIGRADDPDGQPYSGRCRQLLAGGRRAGHPLERFSYWRSAGPGLLTLNTQVAHRGRPEGLHYTGMKDALGPRRQHARGLVPSRLIRPSSVPAAINRELDYVAIQPARCRIDRERLGVWIECINRLPHPGCSSRWCIAASGSPSSRWPAFPAAEAPRKHALRETPLQTSRRNRGRAAPQR